MTYEMNICSVNAEVWQSRRMKCEASDRHSVEYFFDVKPFNIDFRPGNVFQDRGHIPIMTGMPPIKQKLSRNPRSSVTSWRKSQNRPDVGTITQDLQDSRFEAASRLHRESICLRVLPILPAYRVRKLLAGASPVLHSGSSSIITLFILYPGVEGTTLTN